MVGISERSGWRALAFVVLSVAVIRAGVANANSQLCLDGFCIGQGITDVRFEQATWIIPREGVVKEACRGVGCQPAVAFRGYSAADQIKLADAVSLTFRSTERYSLITNNNLKALQGYRYECNPSAGDFGNERRFLAAYRSIPGRFLTVIGLRLIDGELRVYRIARQFPFHNQGDLQQLARTMRSEYGRRISIVDYLSSNAYSEVIEQRTEGWFGRSQLFNPSDLADNAAELVLIDPRTRALLEPSSMPTSGDIGVLRVRLPPQCSGPVSMQ